MRWHLIVALSCLAQPGCMTLLREGYDALRDRPEADHRAPQRRLEPQAMGAELSRDLRIQRPRLIVNSADLDRTRQLIQDDPLARQWFDRCVRHAERLLEAALPRDPKREPMLRTSRQALVRIPTLAGVYKLTGDERFARRAIDEMLAVAAFSDWGSSEFLATAEMSSAVAIGYDWLYGVLTPEQRDTIRQAIVSHGLLPGIAAYERDRGWPLVKHNWNLVCNGGTIVAALAVLDEEPRTSQKVLAYARESIRNGMEGFAPDGGWEEGPMYWNYSTRYLAYALSSLKTALNTDWQLMRSPGFADTGLFRIHTSGPAGLPFNFADGESVIGNSAQMHWMGHALDRPAYAAFEQGDSAHDPGIFDLLWYRPIAGDPLGKLPREAVFASVGVVTMRGRWHDPGATYVAFKGGSNQAHHGHLDLGTFVLDALGQRWAIDLGADDYGLRGYFDDKRWTYYRCSTRGHNTITLNDRNQDEKASAPIIAFSSAAGRSHAVIDLDDAYDRDVGSALRGIALIDGDRVLVQDELELRHSKDLRWSMHTTAEAQISGRTARLQQEGKTLTAHLLSPAGAQFEVADANPPKPQAQMPGLRKLIIHLPKARGAVRIAVLFVPGDQRPPKLELSPLAKWGGRKPRR